MRRRSSYGAIDGAPTGPQSSTPPGIDPLPTDVAAPPVNASVATPDAVPAEQINLDGDSKQMDAKAKAAGLENEPAQLVQGGPIGEARDARGEMTALSKDGPAEALKQQKAALAQSDADMAALQARALASLKQARVGHVGGVKAQQDEFKGGEEQLRAKLSKQAEDVFTVAQTQVQEILRDVPSTAMKKWSTELPFISKQFNDDLKVVKDKIEDRHSGVGGWFVSGWDAVTGLPGWVERAYDAAEKKFGDSVCTLITDISIYVNGIIKIADDIIARARTDIGGIFTQNLPDGLKRWAGEQEKAFGKKLDGLHNKAEETRNAFNKELIENAGGAVQSARESVQKLRLEAGGLWGRFLDAVGRFLDDPVKFIINGLLSLVGISPPAFWGVVAKIEKFFSDIVDAPLRFANNLMAGISRGFSLFFDNIGRHLLEGFLEWLLSGMADEGIAIEIPKELSIKSVVGFFLQLLGISWARIRKLLVEQLGEKAVALIEKAGGAIYALATKGISGIYEDIKKMLEPKTIIDAIVDAAIKYLVGDADCEGRRADYRHAQSGWRDSRGHRGDLPGVEMDFHQRGQDLPSRRSRREWPRGHHRGQHRGRGQDGRERVGEAHCPGHRLSGGLHRPGRPSRESRQRGEGSAILGRGGDAQRHQVAGRCGQESAGRVGVRGEGREG